MRIGIAFDLVPAERDGDGPDDRYEEFDSPETVEAIAAVLRDEGHEVVFLGDGRDFLRRVLDDPPEFVWNFAEGEGIGRSREARVPAALEMLGIPYSGSDPLTLAAALDKDVAKRLVQARDVRVPRGVLYPEVSTFATHRFPFHDRSIYPVILKPAFEGSSKGIGAQCLAFDVFDLEGHARFLHRTYGQPILIEEFIAGDEVTVGLTGNGHDVEVLGIMRILPRQPTEHFVYSLDVKRDYARRVAYEAPARLPGDVLDAIASRARDAYRALGCRDVARIDFRLKDGVPYFLEANPLPGLSPDKGDLVILAQGHGVDYAALIRRILNVALARVGLAAPEPVTS
ncbi:MAG TPA: ATP-grasp domain-containing protein [Isosphaeraceae bacterium]